MRTHAIHKQAPLMQIIPAQEKPMHTSGPWRYKDGGISSASGLHITDINGYGMTKAQDNANARLMAAAPTMLDALQAVADSMEGGDSLLAAQVRDAIRKATQ